MPNLLQDLLFTPSCIGCKRFGIAVCEDCLAKLKPVTDRKIAQVNSVICAHEYSGWLRDQLVEYKSGNYRLARSLAEVLLQKCLVGSTSFNLVPIPTSHEKLLTRQLDTIYFLTKKIKLLNQSFDVLPLLKLIKPVRDQVGLSETERFENLKDAFKATHRVSGKYIIVDDVITTGATVAQAAKALKLAGAQEVSVIGLCASTKVH